MNKNMTD